MMILPGDFNRSKEFNVTVSSLVGNQGAGLGEITK